MTGLDAQHRLALELEHEAQHTVGARVLRPHVDDHRVVVIWIVEGHLLHVLGQVGDAQDGRRVTEGLDAPGDAQGTDGAVDSGDRRLHGLGHRGPRRVLELHRDAADPRSPCAGDDPPSPRA